MFQTFRVRVALLFGLLTVVVMGVLSLALGSMVAKEQERDRGEALQSLARSTASALSEGLFERMREIELLAATPENFRPAMNAQAWQPILDRMQRTRPQYAWIGVTDADGQVRAATGGFLVGKDVAERPWFKGGREAPFAGDVHTAKLLASLLPGSPDGEPLRFIDFAAPLRDAQGRTVGVIGAHGSWAWAAEVVQAVRVESVRERGVQIFILDRDGHVIHHPGGPQAGAKPAPGAVMSPTATRAAWSDGPDFFSVAVAVPARGVTTELGWTVVVRQPVDAALTAARTARQVVLMAGAAAALAVMALAWLLVGRFSRPIENIALAARRIEAGDLNARIPRGRQSRELQQLSEALHGMTHTLMARKQALEQANAGLEARVADRTAALERANAELEKLARKDALTGLFNRRAADDQLKDELARHRRSLGGLAVMMLDVDHFKRVNDTHGHAAGDAVLRELAKRLSRTCRASDFVARYGGEEFIVLMPNSGVEGARVAAEKLRLAAMSEPMPEGVGHVTLSIGIACPAERLDGVAGVLRAADEALYEAKGGGRNRVVVHGQPLSPALERAEA